MSKRVVKKKAPEAPAASAKSEKVSPTLAPAPAPTVIDARVAQQMRVLEVVGVTGSTEKESKKYSPRTETHIKALLPILDHYQYSRHDIASLVQRCHFDENQIQVAVSNIVEDRANHETTSWGVVKGKKQMTEEIGRTNV